MKRAPAYVKRLLAVALLAAAFIIMASVFDPDPTRAGEDSPADGSPSTDPHAGLKCLGSLQNGRYTVRLYSTAQGPRYSVYDSTGKLLVTLRTAAQVARELPDLPLPGLDSNTPQDSVAPHQIMQVDPHDGD